MGNRIRELEQEREQLRQQLEEAWAGPPIATTPPASTSVDEVPKSWKVLEDRLNREGKRIQEEQKQLIEQVKQLQAINRQQAKEFMHANLTVNMCMEKMVGLKQAPQCDNIAPSTPAMPSGTQLPTHQEMGGHVRLPTTSGSFPSPMGTPDSLSVPPVLTPMGSSTPRLRDASIPMLPHLMPQPSASRAALPPLDQEEAMDSEPQAGSESPQ